MKPKYQEIVETIGSEIENGRFKAGSKLPSESMLLKRFETSRITVTRALRELQNAGWIDRVAGSGSYVRLRNEPNQSLLFGLLIPDLGETEIFDAICQGIANAPGSDHALLWGHGMPAEASKEDNALELCGQFVRRKVSGVFFAPLEFEPNADKTNRKILATLQDSDIAVVLLDRRPHHNRTERARLDMVGINNWQAGYTATQHLINLGCRRIGFLGYHAAETTITGRMAGYQDALRAAGLPMSPLEGDANPDAHLDGFVCVNDRMAGQLMHTLLSAGTRIPEDIRIVSIDDASYASLLPVPLTTVRQPSHEIGETALRCMLERIDRPKAPAKEILLDGQLVVRRSCGAA